MSDHNAAGLKAPQDAVDESQSDTSALREEIAECAPYATGFNADETLAGRYDNLRLGGER